MIYSDILTLIAIFCSVGAMVHTILSGDPDLILFKRHKVILVHFHFTFMKLHKTNHNVKDILSVMHIFGGTTP